MAYTTLNSLLTAIANAIRAKKGTTAQINAQNFPSEINSITLATGNAGTGDVLSGKTFSNSNGNGLKGTMPKRENGTNTTSSGKDNEGLYFYIPYGYYPEYSNGNALVRTNFSQFNTIFNGMLIATSNSNTVTKSGRSGGDASQSTQVTFSASYISAIIACGSSKNDGGGTGGATCWSQPKVYATKANGIEVECAWNDTRKCYVVPDVSSKYTKVRAYVYGFSGSEMVHAMIGCLYVFGS